MKKRSFGYAIGCTLLFVVIAAFAVRPVNTPIQLGAYYFDGWAKASSGHLTPRLRDSFPDRKPKWGWVTSTPEIVQAQIDLAADAGLSFFSFCWYYPAYDHQHFKDDALNHALGLYLKAPNKNRLKFSLMVANHEGQEIGPADWPAVTDEWVSLFKDPGYLQVGKKPLIAFFNVASLVRLFGSQDAVHQAMDALRDKARAGGLSGVTIAGCISPGPKAEQDAKNCGFDLITGYNYPNLGFRDHKMEHDVDSLNNIGQYIWNRYDHSTVPYIPVATLNWDPRPWATPTNFYGKSVRYTGYSSASVYRAVESLKDWIGKNPNATTAEHVALLYAWNEYGEGSWLTPTENDTLHLLDGVKKAVSEN